jgi:hypothetical protein
MTVTIDDMRPHLLTLDQVHQRVSANEPISQHTFPVSPDVSFEVSPGWADGEEDEPSGAYLTVPSGNRYELTKLALLEAGAQCGIPRQLQQRQPAQLELDQLSYWFREGLGTRDFKIIYQERPGDAVPLVRAMCRGTITPFSNVKMLEILQERNDHRYGSDTEILFDYKSRHDLEATAFRAIIPDTERLITGTRVPDGDPWCLGVDYRNSLIGLKPTDFAGYSFRYWCTNGCTNTLLSSGKFSRRGAYDEADAFEWAQQSVDKVLGGLESTLDLVQELTKLPVTGDVTTVLADLFNEYSIPVRERNRVISLMADMDGEITMYDVQAAITNAANAEDLSAPTVARLLALGGHVLYAGTSRCSDDDPCHRLLPSGWSPTPAHQAAAEHAAQN